MLTTDQLNSALAGRYAIERLVGEGGMATVYLARDVRHNRRVALKVLKPDLGAVVGVERFLSEIQVTANLQHPNLLPLFDSGQTGAGQEGGGVLFYVMPYVEGESLRARLDREKQLPIDEAVRMASAIASALDYAHRHGVIHRDLKPENILLHEGQPLVADFGIALAVSNAGGSRITQTGLSLGTPQYMSPEQATGDRVIDGRTDIYSLGAVTYEMLTGEAPHIGNTSQAIIARVLTEKPRSVRTMRPSVPEHIDAAVTCALEKLPADRWASAREFSEALSGTRVVTRPAAATVPVEPSSFGPARASMRERVAWGVAVIGVAAATMLALRVRPAPPPALVRAEFEIMMPDSIRPQPFGGAAGVALSRDGSTIVFQGRRPSGRPVLFLRRLDDQDVQAIRGADSARAPVLSPDGAEVLFTFGGGDPQQTVQMRRVSVGGGTSRIVVDTASGNGQTSWSDDGKVVFGFRGRLWTAPADGGPKTLLAEPDSSRGHRQYGFPDALPGGKAAVITVQRGAPIGSYPANAGIDSLYLATVTIPGGKVSELNIRGSYPRYSSTGHLLYVTTDAVLMAVPFDSRTLRVSSAPVPVVDGVFTGAGGAASFAVARNGTLAYFGGRLARGDQRLVAVSRSGVERALPMNPGHYQNPRVSPTGQHIAVAMGTAGIGSNIRNPDIWRLDTTARTLTRVTTDSNSTRPAWSRDGERVAFVRPRIRQAGDSSVGLRSLYAAAAESILIKVPYPIGDVSLGPAGTYVAIRVLRATNNSDIWLAHLDSVAAPRPFLTEPYNELAPRVSPDGRYLAFVSDRTGRLEVYVRPILGGGSDVQVSIDGGTEPVWNRDGRELFYRGPNSVIAAHFVPGSRLAIDRREQLFIDASYLRIGATTNFDIFPGGQEFVMVRRGLPEERDEFPLVVVMNWHTRLQTPRP